MRWIKRYARPVIKMFNLLTAKIDLLYEEELFVLCHILPCWQNEETYGLLKKISVITHQMKRKEDACPVLWKDTEGARWRGGMKNRVWKKKNSSSSGKWKEWLKEEEEGGRRRQWGVYVGVIGALHQAAATMGSRAYSADTAGRLEPFMTPLFVQWGKEMLMFTLTTSRLYSVNVKLHRRVHYHPPCLYTSFIYIFKNTALTQQNWHFCLFIFLYNLYFFLN